MTSVAASPAPRSGRRRKLILLCAQLLVICSLVGCRLAAVQAGPSGTHTMTAALPTTAIPETRTPAPVTPSEAAPHAAAASPSVQLLPAATSPAPPATSRPATAQPTALSTDWTELPVVPVIDASMQSHLREIYARGQELGNNPQAFSKVGDCGSTPAWFLGDFDRGPRYYSLGEYTALEEVIQVFQGSFDRTSLAAKAGFTTASVLAPLWADRKQCQSNESPLACEYRLHRPSIALITLGTNDIWHEGDFEPQLRTIIETSLDQGVIPVLATKADDLEGDGSINATIVRLAREYNLPVWNYWRAVQPLPDRGLQEDSAHITWGPNRFDDPEAMQKGWPWRNLTALQVLDAVWRSLTP